MYEEPKVHLWKDINMEGFLTVYTLTNRARYRERRGRAFVW